MATTSETLDDQLALGLSFDVKDGPLLAVAGLCGGAGASTLSYLVAAAAARCSRAPILLADGGGPNAGIAVYAHASSAHTLPTAAEILSQGMEVSRGLFATTADGLRLIARGPTAVEPDVPAALAYVLDQAKRAHGLTVIDCGTLAREIDRFMLACATHIAWLLPATVSGELRASRLLDHVGHGTGGREVVVARMDPAERKAPIHELTALAERRNAPLVLMPQIGDLAETGLDDVLEAASGALHALATVLHR
jgi:MinD-like ATPase involved in chromosome partitioning or flagellar assembly